MNTIIIQGSSRSVGHSSKIVELIKGQIEADVIDLNAVQILPFRYDQVYSSDDFISVVQKILRYDQILFVTPVYWYSMSAVMKNFFDRLTDCLISEKELGRQLRGKSMGAISCGSDDEETLGFFEPFRKSADYLGMQYLGNVHTWMNNDEELEQNVERIRKFCDSFRSAEG